MKPRAMWPPIPMHSAKMIHSRIMEMIAKSSWEAMNEAGTANQHSNHQCYTAGVLADSISVAVIRLDR
jgi:hypothetical protein